MVVFKCKMCGASLNVEEDVTVVECEYCGSKQTLPDGRDEKKLKLYERANKLRFNCEFDKAEGVYENIISEFPEDAECYWGNILCKYGIEYVDDPVTSRKVPTCHRSSFDSIFDDADFEMIMENADAISRGVYREQAKEIEEIRKSIIEISGKEQPYDIFICYKETDENGSRTIDSVIAQDVYDALSSKGYRVFFSRISLEDKLGTEYEPYIFAALNSAKVMLAFGTSYDNYNAVWVKNEWSRFLKLMASDKEKYLIPCYKDIDAYDIPKEFAKFQAQDMGKVGAVQDLLRGIDKILNKNEASAVNDKAPDTQSNHSGSTSGSLLERAFMFLEDGEWDSANEYCEKVLDIEPKNAEAYLGKLMASLNVTIKTGLVNAKEPFDNDINYLKVIKFGDESLKTELEGYINTIKDRNNLNNLNSIYNEALQLFKEAKNDGKLYLKAKSKFDEIPDYKDSAELSAKCASEYENWKQDIENKVEAIARAAEAKKTGRQELSPDEKIEKLQKEKTTLETKKAEFPTAQKEYEELTENKKNAELKITELAEKKKTLGAFKGKEKKAIDAETEKLQSDIRKLDNNLFTLKDKLNDSPEEIDRKISFLQSEINQLETEKKNQRDNNYISFTFLEAKQLMQDSNIRELFMKKHSSLQYLFADTGDTVTLGRYNNGKGLNPILWKVLAKEGNRALLITKYGIDCKKYNDQQEKTSWEKCTLRKWMNNDFYNAAFSDSEKKMISVTNVTADANPDFNTPQGNNTQDKVFLLSINEAKKYFASDAERQCTPTEYAVENSAHKNPENGKCWWWLRSSGIHSDRAASVFRDGSVSTGGGTVVDDSYVVRPALWINL